MMKLYYIHDPMCSWCWAFRPVWQQVQEQLSSAIRVEYVLGGLAPDSAVPMSASMQVKIKSHWTTIQKKVPGTMFNFDFWTLNIARRSTYPACRAVIATKNQRPDLEDAMIQAIQQAYYLQARNPSDEDVLLDLAKALDLDLERFVTDMRDAQTQLQLLSEIRLYQSLGAQGFPSLVLQGDQKACRHIHLDYSHAERMIDQIEDHVKKGEFE